MSAAEALLVLVFRSARVGRQPNLTLFCRRRGLSVAQLQRAFDRLEQQELVSISPAGERLTLQGLAVATALANRMSHRPPVSCRRLAA